MSDFEIEDSPLPPVKAVWTGNPISEVNWVSKWTDTIKKGLPAKAEPEEQWSGRKVEPILASYPPPFTNYLIGGPLNGQRRASVGNARVVQVQHEGATLLYERGDKPNNDAIYFCGCIEEGAIELNERILSNS